MKNAIYVVIDNQQAGPYSPEQIREMLKKMKSLHNRWYGLKA